MEAPVVLSWVSSPSVWLPSVGRFGGVSLISGCLVTLADAYAWSCRIADAPNELVAHQLEAEFRYAVLAAIADGVCERPDALARMVLKASKAPGTSRSLV